MPRSSAFIAPMGDMSPNSRGPQFASSLARTGSAVTGLYQALPQEVKDQAKSTVAKYTKDAFDKYGPQNRTGNNNPKGPSNGGGNRRSSGSSNNGGGSYALSKAPNPQKVSLNTGIQPNCYTSDYLDTKNLVCSPLYIKCVAVQIPTSTTNDLYNFFTKVITFNIQANAQHNVGFNVPLTDLSTANILTGFNNLLDALQVYYYYASIITYFSDVKNMNEGMQFLRSSISASTLDSLSQLGRRLAITPIPPKMLELVRYLSSNFYSGDSQGSSIIKFSPIVSSNTMLDDTRITTALTNLGSDANNKMFSLLRRCVPSWVPEVLPDVPLTPIWDPNFMTIFSNAPKTHWITSLNYYPSVASSSTPISYLSWTNNLDGMAFSLTSTYDTSKSAWNPGLLTPVYTNDNSGGLSLRGYYEVSGTKIFRNVLSTDFLKYSVSEAYTLDGANAVLNPHILGTDRVLGVCGDTIKETNYKALEYLMSLDTLKASSGYQRSGFSPSGSTPTRRSR